MIPADVVSRLRANTAADSALQPVAPTAKLADVLAEFQPGQRIMAEIQALLPNGAYRAVVGQREITLALPFAAKAGDALELEVVDNDGQLALALLTGKNKEAGAAFSTSFSSAGQMISDLMKHLPQAESGSKGVQLNGGIPLLQEVSDKQPLTGETLAPVLQKAVTDSGVFYEAHQAQWVNGQQATEQLLQEPQGKLSQPQVLDRQAQVAADTATPATTLSTPPDVTATRSSLTGVPEHLAPIVQQQLDTLSNQTLHWQGQVWPGQVMDWEVQDQQTQDRGVAALDEEQRRWRTRLRLDLPGLGVVEASLVLQGSQNIEIQLQAGSASTQAQLRNHGQLLQNQLENAGLQLSLFGVRAPGTETATTDHAAGQSGSDEHTT